MPGIGDRDKRIKTMRDMRFQKVAKIFLKMVKKYLHLNKTLVIINGLLLKQEKSPHRLAVRTRPFQG